MLQPLLLRLRLEPQSLHLLELRLLRLPQSLCVTEPPRRGLALGLLALRSGRERLRLVHLASAQLGLRPVEARLRLRPLLLGEARSLHACLVHPELDGVVLRLAQRAGGRCRGDSSAFGKCPRRKASVRGAGVFF